MKHSKLSQLERVANVYRAAPRQEALPRKERLQRWAGLLESCRYRKLNSLHGTEYQSAEALDLMRCDNSPLTIAFMDPILRADGLENDTYGSAKRYFGLTDDELHSVVCFCFHGEAMSARVAAWRVRSLVPRTPLWVSIRRAFHRWASQRVEY